jgi:hypothetical protein
MQCSELCEIVESSRINDWAFPQAPKTDSYIRDLNRLCLSRNSEKRSLCPEIRSQHTRGLRYVDLAERILHEINFGCWSRWFCFLNIYETSLRPCFIARSVTWFARICESGKEMLYACHFHDSFIFPELTVRFQLT